MPGWLRMLVSAVLTALVLLAAPVRAEPAGKPADVLGSDPRLQKPVTLDGEVQELRLLLRDLQRLTGVPLRVQGDLVRRPVAIGVTERPGAKLLESVAVLFGGQWVARDGGYLLVTEEVRAAMKRAESETQVRRVLASLLDSLNREQWMRMRLVRCLYFRQMTPTQQNLALFVARNSYLRHPERYPSSVLTGRDCQIDLARLQNDQGSVTVRLSLSDREVSEEGKLVRGALADKVVRDPNGDQPAPRPGGG